MIAVIVLAAGQSSRMGTNKLLLPLGDRPIIAHVVDAAAGSGLQPVVVVLGHGADQIQRVLAGRGVNVVINQQYAAGLSTSVRAGLAALPETATGAIIALGDQPGASASQFAALAAHARTLDAPILVSTYGGRRGNPVYFARALFDELSAVTGDTGGRQVMARHPELVHELAFGDAVFNDDLDTPDDYQRALMYWRDADPPDA